MGDPTTVELIVDDLRGLNRRVGKAERELAGLKAGVAWLKGWIVGAALAGAGLSEVLSRI